MPRVGARFRSVDGCGGSRRFQRSPVSASGAHAWGEAPSRGVAAGRSAQRACSRSCDWRRGAAGSPDPDDVMAGVNALTSTVMVVVAGLVGVALIGIGLWDA